MVNQNKNEFVWVYQHLKNKKVMLIFRCTIILISILFCAVKSSWAQDVAVGLANRKTISTLLFSPVAGTYVIESERGDTIYRFKTDDAIAVSVVQNKLVLKSPYGLKDTVNFVKINGAGSAPSFRIRMNDDGRDYHYFDNVAITVAEGALRVINHVSIERYVAKVVQSEVGNGAEDEYYKIQSIICRTYAVRNLIRHAVDGYDLCDHEHCQVYSGLKSATHQVMKATSATSGLIMVDGQNEPILSAFHANCGGQTSNSEDAWREQRSYLRSVRDTFCITSRSAVWEKSMPLDVFVTQLGFETDTVGLTSWSFLQPERKKYFKLQSDSVSTTQMRRLLQLRSTLFDVEIKNGNVNLKGRGFGHGVGLCQQGAIKMAEWGYTYSQILGYYYKGVSLIPVTALQPSK